jgi:hypothetical protein
MRPQEHNKYVGLAHLGYAGLHLLMTTASMGFAGFMFKNIRPQELGGPQSLRLMGLMVVLVGIMNLVTTIPPVMAGYALLRRRPWGKIAGIVGGVVASMSFPIGTAVAVYTFWFLFSDVGRQLYDHKNRDMPPLPPEEWQLPSENPWQQRTLSSTSPPDWT